MKFMHKSVLFQNINSKLYEIYAQFSVISKKVQRLFMHKNNLTSKHELLIS